MISKCSLTLCNCSLCSKKWKCHDSPGTIDEDNYWWVLSKIYITDACKVNDALGPEDVDPLAIFSLMTRCKQFAGITSKASEVR